MAAADREDPKKVFGGMCLIAAAGAKVHGNGEPFPMIEATELRFYGTLGLPPGPLDLFSRPPYLSAIPYSQITLRVFSGIGGLFIGRPGANRKECSYIVQP